MPGHVVLVPMICAPRFILMRLIPSESLNDTLIETLSPYSMLVGDTLMLTVPGVSTCWVISTEHWSLPVLTRISHHR